MYIWLKWWKDGEECNIITLHHPLYFIEARCSMLDVGHEFASLVMIFNLKANTHILVLYRKWIQRIYYVYYIFVMEWSMEYYKR